MQIIISISEYSNIFQCKYVCIIIGARLLERLTICMLGPALYQCKISHGQFFIGVILRCNFLCGDVVPGFS